MVDMRSGPVIYNVGVGEAVLNKHIDHMKAATLQMGQEQSIAGPSEYPPRLSEPMGSPLLPCVKEDTANVAASTPLLPEEEDEFQLRCSKCKKWTTLWCTPLVSEADLEEPDL
eukprot:g37481.t1